MSGFGIVSLAMMLMLHDSCSLDHRGEVPDTDGSEFALSVYCKSMCQWGHGGNLCNCHAAYFAGKRSASSSSGSDVGRVPVVPGRSTGVNRQSTVVDDTGMWMTLAAERHPLTKLSGTADGRDTDSETAEDDVERRWWTGTEELRRHLRSTASNSFGRSQNTPQKNCVKLYIRLCRNVVQH